MEFGYAWDSKRLRNGKKGDSALPKGARHATLTEGFNGPCRGERLRPPRRMFPRNWFRRRSELVILFPSSDTTCWGLPEFKGIPTLNCPSSLSISARRQPADYPVMPIR